MGEATPSRFCEFALLFLLMYVVRFINTVHESNKHDKKICALQSFDCRVSKSTKPLYLSEFIFLYSFKIMRSVALPCI